MPDERDLVGATLSAGPDQIPHVGTAEGVGSSLIVPHAASVAVGAPRAGAVVSGLVTLGGYNVPVAGEHTQRGGQECTGVSAPRAPGRGGGRPRAAESGPRAALARGR